MYDVDAVPKSVSLLTWVFLMGVSVVEVTEICMSLELTLPLVSLFCTYFFLFLGFGFTVRYAIEFPC